MSKVFEEEYRQMAETEIPDLWDRIEAGLQEKTVAAPLFSDTTINPVLPDAMATAVHSDRKANSVLPGGEIQAVHSDTKAAPTTNSEFSEITTKSTQKHGIAAHFRRYFGRYAGLVAACLCVAVIIPAAINAGRNNDRQFAAEQMEAAPEAAAPVAEMAAAEEAPASAVAADEAIAEEDVMGEAPARPEAGPAADTADSAATEPGMTAETAENTVVDEKVAGSEQGNNAGSSADMEITDGEGRYGESSLKEGTTAGQQQSEEEAAQQREKWSVGTVIKAVSFTVTAADETGERVIYRASVAAEADGLLTVGEEIIFVKKAGIKTDITVGKSYQADLSYCGESAYHYEADEIKEK